MGVIKRLFVRQSKTSVEPFCTVIEHEALDKGGKDEQPPQAPAAPTPEPEAPPAAPQSPVAPASPAAPPASPPSAAPGSPAWAAAAWAVAPPPAAPGSPCAAGSPAAARAREAPLSPAAPPGGAAVGGPGELAAPRRDASGTSSPSSPSSRPAALERRGGSPKGAAAPAPEASAGIEPRFDATLEQIYAGISQAYGHMIAASLQSSKWDKRSQAIKAVTSALEAGGGRDGAARAAAWRLSCQLLHHVMRDKVMPVRLAACDLFVATFAKAEATVSQAEGRFALSTLLEHLIDRLGDSNLRLHESARRCVLFAAELSSVFGLGAVLARLRARLEGSRGSERTKAHFGILDAVSVLLEHFPGRRGGVALQQTEGGEDDDLFQENDAGRGSADSWTQHDVAPFITAGMDDALGQRVRDRAVALAVAVYQTFGAEAMKPLLAGLRPAKQALLRQKFSESEMEEGEFPDDEDDGEEGVVLDGAALEGLVVCGSGVRPPDWFASSTQPALPGAVGDEEVLMDGILEDAGMVFGGTGIASEPVRDGAGGACSLSCSQSLMYAGLLREEECSLDEELRGLGFGGLECLEEQQALLQSFEGDPRPSGGQPRRPPDELSVEDLLDSFDECGSLGVHEASIEVF